MPAPDRERAPAAGAHADRPPHARAAGAGARGGSAPDLVLVYGDTNSTLAGALAAASSACRWPTSRRASARGLRMPEELNSILTTTPAICCCARARRPGEPPARGWGTDSSASSPTHDRLPWRAACRGRSRRPAALGLSPGVLLATVHRAGNVDDPTPRRAGGLLEALPAGAPGAPEHRARGSRRPGYPTGSRRHDDRAARLPRLPPRSPRTRAPSSRTPAASEGGLAPRHACVTLRTRPSGSRPWRGLERARRPRPERGDNALDRHARGGASGALRRRPGRGGGSPTRLRLHSRAMKIVIGASVTWPAAGSRVLRGGPRGRRNRHRCRRVAALERGESHVEDISTERLRPARAAAPPRASPSCRGRRGDHRGAHAANLRPRAGSRPAGVRRHLARRHAASRASSWCSSPPPTRDHARAPRAAARGVRPRRRARLQRGLLARAGGPRPHRLHDAHHAQGGGRPDAGMPRARVELYSEVCDQLVPVSTPEAAELAKLLENVFRSVNIALVNELAMLCDRMGIDVWEVVEAAATKPYGFMRFDPGPGMGGHCLPVDPFYLPEGARVRPADRVRRAGGRGEPADAVLLRGEDLARPQRPLEAHPRLEDRDLRRLLQAGRGGPARVAGAQDHAPAAGRGGELHYNDDFVPELPDFGLEQRGARPGARGQRHRGDRDRPPRGRLAAGGGARSARSWTSAASREASRRRNLVRL